MTQGTAADFFTSPSWGLLESLVYRLNEEGERDTAGWRSSATALFPEGVSHMSYALHG